MSAHVIVPLAVLALIGTSPAARAQTAPDSTGGIPGLCWKARPRPDCRMLLITNFGAYLDYPKENRVNERRLEGDLGLMFNVSRRDAVGGSVFFLTDKNGRFSKGLALRYRRWLGATNSVEAAVGIRGGADLIDNGAVIGMVKYNFGPYVGVVLRPELLRRCPPWWGGLCGQTGSPASRLRVSVGLELGSWLGVAAGALVGFVAAVISAATPHIL